MVTATMVLLNLVASVFLAVAVYAQPQPVKLPPQGTILKKLPQGMTSQQLQQRLSAALARFKTDAQNQAQQSQREAKAIFDTTANERAAVNAALAKDPRYKTFQNQVKQISSSTATSAAKAQQLRVLAKANQGIFAEAFRAAKIDHNGLQAKLRAVVPGITLMSDFSVRKGLAKRIPSLKTFTPTPTTKEFVLRPPFTFEEFEADNGGIAASSADANADADRGRATSTGSVLGVAGGATATASFGEFVNVPAGVKRVEFTITTKTSYNASALGAAGIGRVYADVDLFIENDTASQHAREGQHDSITAAIAWYAEMEGGRTGDYKFSFDVPAKGEEYVITGQSRISAFGGGIGGYADGFARTEIDKITVKYFYE